MLLVSLGQRSLSTRNADSLVTHILTLLANKLSPLKESQSTVGESEQDLLVTSR